MAWAHVQSTGNFSTATATTLAQAYAGAVTLGNLLVVGCCWVGTTATCTVADSVGNTFTAIAASLATGATLRSQVFWAPVTSIGTPTVTMTVSASGNERDIFIGEYSGLATAGQPDAGGVGTGTSTAASGSITTVAAPAMLYGICRTDGAASASGATGRSNQNGNQSEDRNQAAAGATTTTFTISPSSAWEVATASFKESGSASPAFVPHRMPLGV